MYRYINKEGQEKREKLKLLSILLPAMLVPLETILKSTFHCGVSPLSISIISPCFLRPEVK